MQREKKHWPQNPNMHTKKTGINSSSLQLNYRQGTATATATATVHKPNKQQEARRTRRTI
jgi:hypothetical protein